MSSECINVSEAIWNSVRDGIELNEQYRHHTLSCRSCAQAFADAQTAVAALGCAKSSPPAPDCRQLVMARVNPARRANIFTRLAWVMPPVAVAAVLLIALYHGSPNQAIKQPEVSQRPTPLTKKQDAGPKVANKSTVAPSSAERKPRPAPRPVPIHIALAPPVATPMLSKADFVGVPGQTPEKQPVRPPDFRPGNAGCSTNGGLAPEPLVTPAEERAYFRQMLQSQVDQIGALIAGASEGASLIKRGVSANPSAKVCRLQKWGDLPFATVCPVSTPVETTLPGFGFGKILGTATILDYEGSAAYLVFVRVPVELTSEGVTIADDPDMVLLLAVKAGSSGTATYEERARAELVQHVAPQCGSTPLVSVSYADSGAVIEMSWAKESYKFVVKQQFIFL